MLWPFEISDPIEVSSRNFVRFLDEIDEAEEPIEEPCVADLILLWLTSGDAIEWFGTYESWLLGVIAMLDWWDSEMHRRQSQSNPHKMWSSILRAPDGSARTYIPMFRFVDNERSLYSQLGWAGSAYGHPALNRETFELAKRRRTTEVENAILRIAISEK